jgi:magnesium transporter
MPFFVFHNGSVQSLDSPPEQLVPGAFGWWVMTRLAVEAQASEIHTSLQRLTSVSLLDLHLQDLCSPNHPSHYDYTSDYDLVIFRRLTISGAAASPTPAVDQKQPMPVLPPITTHPVGFVVFDRVLVSVHDESCGVAGEFVRRLASEGGRKPTSSSDLMLRMVNAMVDSYLDLRKQLSAQLDRWQIELLSPTTKQVNWRALLATRNQLHALEDLCDEQHDAMQEWLDTLQEQPLRGHSEGELMKARNERDMLVARSRDIIEHIQRVVHHVRRLEQSAETAVQIHFSAQSHRANDIMRTLTALTAIFLPLNLIAGIFGMNFEFLPFIHTKDGFWMALGVMAITALGLTVFFWRKRYLARTRG